jgi:hypothetical protein
MFKILITAALSKGREAGQWEFPPALKEGLDEERFYDLLKVVTFTSEKYGDHLRGAYLNEMQLWTTGEQTLHQTLTNWVNPLLNEVWYDLLPPSTYLPKHGLGAFLKGSSVEQGKLLVDPTQTSFSDEGIGIGAETAKSKELKTQKYFGSMAAFIREKPFISTVNGEDSMWFGLPTWVIPEWLIQTSDLGRSGDQRFNLFELLADFGMGPQKEQTVMAKPQWLSEDIKRRGLRTLQQSTRFHSQAENGLENFFKEDRAKWQQLLVDWFSPAPYLRQGSITVLLLLPEIRVGHKVLIVPNDNPALAEQFYVEGVQLGYSGANDARSPITGLTTLMLSRGFRGSDYALYQATKTLSGKFTEVR